MPKRRDRPILDRMLSDVKNKSRSDVSSNMKDRVDKKTENHDFVYPTEVDDQSTNYENPFVCDYPFEANPVKIGKNFACKLPTNETTQKELSYFETPWLQSN